MMKMLLAVHIGGGATALLSMFLPLLSRKGGLTHRRAGWVFVTGMTVVAITALLLAGTQFLTDRSENGHVAGAFLFYIALLTGAGVSAGVRVLRTKRRTTVHRHPWDLSVASLLTAGAVLLAVYGLAIGQALLIAFSIIGFINGGGQLAYWLRPPSEPMHWWYEHMNQMLGACIAATTAFIVNNAGRLGLPNTSLLVWLGPAAIGVPAGIIWTRYYRRRFAGTHRSVPASVAATVMLLVLALAAAPATAQTPAPLAFDAASVKANKTDVAQTIDVKGTDVRLTHWALRPIIQLAFGVDQPSKLSGVPSWAESDRWDIVAKGDVSSRDQFTARMRSLLAERFKLTTHVEQRQVPIYRLVPARPGEAPKLRVSTVECLGQGAPSSPPGAVRCGPQPGEPGILKLVGSPLGLMAGILSLMTGRPVIDGTGLTGRFDIELTSASEAERAAGSDRPSIFTALQEQLGLKLEPATQAQEVLVIDHVERPDAD